MDYILVVPTHRRAHTFLTKTYALLQKMDAPKPILWVNDEIDKSQYEALGLDLDIIIGGKNIGEKRNMIQAHYPLNAKIVMIDDDIKNIVMLDGEKTIDVLNFDGLVHYAFNVAESIGVNMWGVYPLCNPFFLKEKIRVGPCYIIAAFFGIINKRIMVETNYAEDYERSILHFLQDQKLLRLEFVGLDTKYYTEKGGLQETRTELYNYRDKKILADKYPNVVKLVEKKRTELVFLHAKGLVIQPPL